MLSEIIWSDKFNHHTFVIYSCLESNVKKCLLGPFLTFPLFETACKRPPSSDTRATLATSYPKDSGALRIESHEPSDPEPFFASRQRELWVNKKLDVFLKFDAISEQSEWVKQIERIGSTLV